MIFRIIGWILRVIFGTILRLLVWIALAAIAIFVLNDAGVISVPIMEYVGLG